MALTQVPISMLGSDAQYVGFKNRIINGAMAIAQRGTSAAITTAWSYLTVDRFVCNQDTAAAGTMSQVAISDLSGFRYAAKIQRTASATNTGAFHFGQAIETANSADLQGKQVTLSFYAKCGANFSGASSQISALIANGAVVDQPITAIPSAVVSGNMTLSTTWQRFSITGNVLANSTQLGWYLTWTPTGTAGADDSIYITGVQLEAGGAPTAYDFREYGYELRQCQRYFISYGGNAVYERLGLGICNGTTSHISTIFFPVEMRSAPTYSYAPAAANFGVWNGAGVITVTGFGADSPATKVFTLQAIVASGLTLGAVAQLLSNNTTTARLTFSAEL